VNGPEPFFLESVRSEDKKAVITLVEADFRHELESLQVPVHRGWPGIDKLRERFEQGDVPVVLISSWRIWNEKSPHWVTITGFTDRFVFVHDPWDSDSANVREKQENKKAASAGKDGKPRSGTARGVRPGDRDRLDGIDMPIPIAEFERMARYGRRGQRAVLLVGDKQ